MTSFNSIFKPALILSAALLLTVQNSKAQSIPLTTSGTAYTQDFDALSSAATTTNNVLAISGWSLTESGGNARDNEQYAVDNGSNNAGDTYSYGTAASSDRALGNVRSGTLISLIGAAFTNTTGTTIGSLDISYVGEQWRLGVASRTDQLNFEYSINATGLTTGTWTAVPALNFITPTTITVGAKDGNAAANRTLLTSTITGLSIPDGATFWIRWNDADPSGADDGLAVDDFTLTPYTTTAVAAPEMDIQGNSTSIGDGSAFPVAFNHTYFGDQSVCAGVLTRTFTILNTGNAVLTLTGTPVVSLTGLDAADFTVTSQPSNTIAVGGSSSFVIEFNPSAAGSRDAIVEIANNDADENPYEFYILGMGVDVTATLNSQTNILCNGGANGAISVTADGMGTLNYDWAPGTPTGDGTATITAVPAGVYTLTVTDVNSCSVTVTYTVTEPSALTVNAMASNTILCAGNSSTLTASGNGGTGVISYTWNTTENTSSITVTPSLTTTYTINVMDANGCQSSNTVSVVVNAIPTLTVNSGAVCAGESFTITASGADTYTYTGGSAIVTPTTTMSYSVSGTSVDGCVSTVDAVSTVTVNALPTLSITPSDPFICAGETATLTAGGADTYTWSTTETTAAIAVSPTVTTNYSVTATDVNSCMNTASISFSVSLCTGIASIDQQAAITIYPNPSNGEYTLDLPVSAQVEISNQLGQVIYRNQLTEGKNHINIKEYAEGVYFLKTIINGKVNTTKVIKQ